MGDCGRIFQGSFLREVLRIPPGSLGATFLATIFDPAFSHWDLESCSASSASRPNLGSIHKNQLRAHTRTCGKDLPGYFPNVTVVYFRIIPPKRSRGSFL